LVDSISCQGTVWCGPFVTLVVTRSTHDYVESKIGLRVIAYRFHPLRSGILLIISYGMLLQMISIVFWVTLFLGVTCNTCGVYIYDSSNKYTIQHPYKPSVFSFYFVPTSLFFNSIHSVMPLLTLIF